MCSNCHLKPASVIRVKHNPLTSGDLLSNNRRAVAFGSSQLGLRDASIGGGGGGGGEMGRGGGGGGEGSGVGRGVRVGRAGPEGGPNEVEEGAPPPPPCEPTDIFYTNDGFESLLRCRSSNYSENKQNSKPELSCDCRMTLSSCANAMMASNSSILQQCLTISQKASLDTPTCAGTPLSRGVYLINI